MSDHVKLRRRRLKDGRLSLYLDSYHHGKRTYRWLGLYLTGNRFADAEVLRIAEAERLNASLGIARQEHGIAAPTDRPADLAAYLRTMADSRRPQYARLFRQTAAMIDTFTESRPVALRSITADWLRRLLMWARSSKLAAATISLRYTLVRMALREAHAAGLIHHSPLEGAPKNKGGDSDRPYLTAPELQRLAAQPCRHPEIRRAFLFACYTGLRSSDIRALHWRQIDGDVAIIPTIKTGRVERLPLSQQARELLGEPSEPDTPVFHLPSREQVGVHLRRWCKDAGLKPLSFHASRHTFATLALTYGADLYTVSKLLGHRDVRTTQIYARIVDERRREAVELLPPLKTDSES